MQLKNQSAELAVFIESKIDFYASISGARGVTRELLNELLKSDPSNPLLDKEVRDNIFNCSFNQISKKLIGTTYQQRYNFFQEWRDEVYGAEGSSKRGPKKSQITPNNQIRADVKIPPHITDREKLLGLVERMSADLKRADPNAPSLKDEVLNEYIKELN